MPKLVELANNKAFCIMPFIHLHINEHDMIKPCCYAKNFNKKYTKDFNFETDTVFLDARNRLLNGQPIAECQGCYNVEKNNLESFRIRDTIEWMDKLNIESINDVTTDLIYYDIRNDNLCNLSCRMCHPGASSQLEKEYKEIGWAYNIASRNSKLSEIVNYDKIQQLYIAGGEPTLMPEFKKFLKTAIDKNKTDIKLRIITNGTNVNKEILKLLQQFPNIEFTISLDGYKDVNKYIRWPSDWDAIDKNIDKIKLLTDNISFNVAVSIWNITSLSKLVTYLESKFDQPTIFFNEAMSAKQGVNYSASIFPNKDLAVADLKLLKKTKSYNHEYFFKEKVDYFIDLMSNTKTNLYELEKFFKFNDTLDQSRNIKLINYIPELEECRALITKQI